MNRTERMTIPAYSTRWTKRPTADADCCQRHQRAKRADDRQRQRAAARAAKRGAWIAES